MYSTNKQWNLFSESLPKKNSVITVIWENGSEVDQIYGGRVYIKENIPMITGADMKPVFWHYEDWEEDSGGRFWEHRK